MNFAPFWARAKSGGFIAWRWSFQSAAEAQSLANQAAQQLADRFKTRDLPPKQRGYYPNRPFREQVLQEFKKETGETSAVITRNSYGCLVLNTAQIMFVDIDLPEPSRPGGFLKWLFRKSDIPAPANPQNEALAKIEIWARSNSDWGWRIYRTRSGLRLLATHGLVDAGSDAANDVFEALGADPLYRQLCNTQKCFRARLTPKPWRCGMHTKPGRWPWLDPKQEKRFQKWEAQYQSLSANWATCELIRQLGNPTIHSEIQGILNLHDTSTRAESKLPLA
jgi:hypothetical protein